MGNGRAGIYAVWLIAGLVTWQFIAQFLNRGMSSLLGNGALLRKVYFPSFVPVLAVGLSVGLQSLIELGLVLIVLLAAFLNVSWTWLLIPLWAALLWLHGGDQHHPGHRQCPVARSGSRSCNSCCGCCSSSAP